MLSRQLRRRTFELNVDECGSEKGANRIEWSSRGEVIWRPNDAVSQHAMPYSRMERREFSLIAAVSGRIICTASCSTHTARSEFV